MKLETTGWYTGERVAFPYPDPSAAYTKPNGRMTRPYSPLKIIPVKSPPLTEGSCFLVTPGDHHHAGDDDGCRADKEEVEEDGERGVDHVAAHPF